ncbi:unnamed protein product [Fusarium venenatum]|uniref:Carboxylic ester hydrolase n=1 Tax=Fusarium venenatum TaxID=56646 RepID=A0A2L2U3W7_9HYPO|nr:uncharacterized protein FVRRES_10887 [Fusarium venenatum]CEI70810.1 unnamed protein product [Fusarium venenatum]
MSISAIPPSACTNASIPIPVLSGAEILNLSAVPVLNYTASASENYTHNHPTIEAENIDFCNITITYTHPGQQDNLSIETWLPLNNWNGRIQSVGGGGWVAGRFFISYQAMNGAIAERYVTSSIDAGLKDKSGQTAFVPDEWAMVSEGNVNLYNLQNFGSVSLNDQAIIVKALTKDFYGRPHDYAYWSGCSQGGRQGLTLAQKYPDAYDGIAAAAPAIYMPQLCMANLWSQVVMKERGEYPSRCEFEYIQAAAIEACDPLDGCIDNLVSNESACQFDPMTVVGHPLNCSETGNMTVVSETAAIVAAAAWEGPRTPEGGFLWHGFNKDIQLSGDASGAQTADLGVAQTLCHNGTCSGVPNGLGDKLVTFFLEKNSSATWQNVTTENFAKYFKEAVRDFGPFLGSSDADLSEFRAAGGKMITYHGMADNLIPIKQSYQYYDDVLKNDPNVADFYRLFEVPGLAHCSGGNGGQPTATWAALVAWVENGKSPSTLPIIVKDENGKVSERQLRPYSKKTSWTWPPVACYYQGWNLVETILELPEEGDYILSAWILDELGVNVGSATDYLSIDASIPVPRVFLADLNEHSDDTVGGTNSVTYNFSYAQRIARLNVVGYTVNDFNITQERWSQTLEIIKSISTEGEFVVFPGTKWCSNSAAGGDHNVVFLDDPHTTPPKFPFGKHGNVVRSFEWNEHGPAAWPLDKLYATYAHNPERHLLLPHVGGRRCNLAWHHLKLERLLEISSEWGLFEWLLRDVVQRGRKLGVSANLDEHRGRCGGGVPGTAVFDTKSGLTGVLSDTPGRAEIATALRTQRTFATTGERLVGLVSTEDGQLQGDDVKATGEGPLTLKYQFFGRDGFSTIEAWDASGSTMQRDLEKEV